MNASQFTEEAKAYLEKLCSQIPNRRVGSEGNRLAAEFFAETIASFGFEVECPEFECMDWQCEGAILSVGREYYDAQVSPYSIGAQVTAPLISACSFADLETLDLSDKILLMRGELTKEQLLPKNFPFFRVEEQQRLLRFLEENQPRAIITATTRNPEMAGGLYPFPVFEDGDFDIPSVFMTEKEGARLAECAGHEVRLEIRAERIPARGCNIVARKGRDRYGRVVLFAHIDAKTGTPGALDNGTGIVTLLLLAELLRDYEGDTSIEIVALNGEDYYSNPGEQLYLHQNEGKFSDIRLGINIDGLGYLRGKTAYSLYEYPPELTAVVEEVFKEEDMFVASPAWFQGDHALFLMNGRPALALTSERVGELMAEYIHTERDVPEVVDPGKLVKTAVALQKLLLA
jgi:aminopeptidase YwaD